MKLQKIYSASLTTDLAAAESWYTNLLGCGPDYRPMETLIQRDLLAQGGLQPRPTPISRVTEPCF